MVALMSRRATPIHTDHSARLRVLEAYIETLKAENEILKRRLAEAEARLAARERCPWWCRRLGPPEDRATDPNRGEGGPSNNQPRRAACRRSFVQETHEGCAKIVAFAR